MPYIVNKSFFIGDIVIPNLGQPADLSRINDFIHKYEPECLLYTLGYALYKAFSTESSQRMIDLLGGAEYIDNKGVLRKWQGIFHGYVADYSLINLASARNDEQIIVGTTPGFNAGLQAVVFDGTETFIGSGLYKPDYRGWVIVPSELTGRGILALGLDYSWDKDTGTFILLQVGDILETGTYYNIHFEPKPDPPIIATAMNISLVANYIYFYYQRSQALKISGSGTSVSNKEAGISQSPSDKMTTAWNFFS